MQVVVAGAGIVGLSCAHALAHRGHDVALVASEPSMATTSAVAGASFKPSAVAAGPLTTDLLVSSRRVLQGWDASGFGRAIGMTRHRHVLATDGPQLSLPWAEHLDDVTWQSRDDGDVIVGGFRTAVSFTTWFFDVAVVLPALVDHLATDHGVAATLRRLAALDEVADHCEVIVHAAGLGAKALVGDDRLEPIRGQGVLVTLADPPDWSISADGAYAYPRDRGLFLGGTAEVGSWSLDPDPATTARILAANQRVFPVLADVPAEDVRAVVGLRPYRHEGIRVEVDTTVASVPVVHAYGHGGAGWTLAPGTGERVADLVEVARRG